MLAAVVASAIVLAGGVAWNNGLRDQFFPRRWDAVDPGLIYRSGQIASRLVRPTFEKYHISRIVDLTVPKPGDHDQETELTTARELGIEVLNFPLAGDGTGDIQSYVGAVAALAKRDGRITLLHCSAGVQRTGGAVAIYRVLVQRKSGSEAYAELVNHLWVPGRHERLRTYLNTHMAEIAALLVENGTIDRVPDPLPVVAP